MPFKINAACSFNLVLQTDLRFFNQIRNQVHISSIPSEISLDLVFNSFKKLKAPQLKDV